MELVALTVIGPEKRGGGNMKVSPIMLLKTHIENMSETGYATISMKIMNIEDARHYMYEN